MSPASQTFAHRRVSLSPEAALSDILVRVHSLTQGCPGREGTPVLSSIVTSPCARERMSPAGPTLGPGWPLGSDDSYSPSGLSIHVPEVCKCSEGPPSAGPTGPLSERRWVTSDPLEGVELTTGTREKHFPSPRPHAGHQRAGHQRLSDTGPRKGRLGKPCAREPSGG